MTWLVVSLLLRKRLQKITEILQWSFKARVDEDRIIPIPIKFQKQARWVAEFGELFVAPRMLGI